MSDLVEEILEHHGVKGMKWGQRKTRTVRVSSDHHQVSSLRKKPAKHLTNQELQAINNRLNLEQNFRRLNPGAVSRGQARVKTVLSVLTTAAAVHKFATSPEGKAFIKAGKDFINR